MNNFITSILRTSGRLLRNRAVLITLAVLLVGGLLWYFLRKKNISLSGPVTQLKNLLPGSSGAKSFARLSAGQVEGITIPPHPGTPDLLRIDLFPDMEPLPGEICVWCTNLFDASTANKLLKRGVTHLETQNAQRLGVTTRREERFAILYLNAFGGIPFSMANIGALKNAVDNYIGGQFGGQVEIVSYDPENDQSTDDYGQVLRELALHARQRWGVTWVDFLGVEIANTDFNLTGQPPGQTFFTPYLDDEATYDGTIPYIHPENVENGKWLYIIAQASELFAVVYPDKRQLSYFWNRVTNKSRYVPNHVVEATVLFAWACTGGWLINWDASALGDVIFAADEYFLNGRHRLLKANAYRTGKVRHIVPEVSVDGGASWRLNLAPDAEANDEPLLRLTKNETGWLLFGHDSRLSSGQRTVYVRAQGFPARQVTLQAEKTFLEAIPE